MTIDELKELAKGMPEGPWDIEEDDWEDSYKIVGQQLFKDGQLLMDCDIATTYSKDLAQAIALVPALIDAVIELDAKVKDNA